jgi:hypothetical protein
MSAGCLRDDVLTWRERLPGERRSFRKGEETMTLPVPDPIPPLTPNPVPPLKPVPPPTPKPGPDPDAPPTPRAR